jgi:hypothetical protein
MKGLIRAIRALCASALLIACFGTTNASADEWDYYLYSPFNICDPSVGSINYYLEYWLDGTDHDWSDQDVRVDVSGGPGSWAAGGLSWTKRGVYWLSGRDVAWQPGVPAGTVNCASAAQSFTFTVEYGPVPEAPTEFSGDAVQGGPTSNFAFTAPEADHFVARMWGSGGPITLRSGDRSQTFPSPSGTFDIGVLGAGRHEIQVESGGSSDASYVISLESSRADISNLSPVAARPGASVPVPLTLSGAATVFQQTTDLSGKVVQAPRDGTHVGLGSHSITWKAADDQGKPLPEGRYQLKLTASNDAFGSPANGTVRAVVDGTPPRVQVAALGVTNPSRPLTISASDTGAAASGLAQVTVAVDGGPAVPVSGTYRLTYLPPGGWKTGKHTVQAVAVDQAGNSSTSTASFSIVDTGCFSPSISRAVRGSKPLNASLRRLAKVPHGDILKRFEVAQGSCADLTGDQTNELVTLLRDYKGPATVLAIFKRVGADQWSLMYEDTRHRLDKVTAAGSDLVERVHRTRHHKARSLRLHWNGSAFQLGPA